MRISKSIFLIFAVFLLTGQGCFGGGTDAESNGALWRTDDNGETWTQRAAFPQANGVSSISGVNVRAFEIDPTDKTAFYIGTEANGMFYSYDGGNTWQRPEDEIASNGKVIGIEVDPRDVCTIFVLKTSGVIKSTDCARTFVTVFEETRSNVFTTTMVMDWFNPDIIWIGETSGDVVKTVDGGANWTPKARFGEWITAMTVSNADSRTILVGTEKDGVYRSTNGGEDWTSLEEDVEEFRGADSVYGFTQTRDGKAVIMNTEYGLLRSTDTGATWDNIVLVTAPGDVRIWSVDFDPEDATNIHYATNNLFYTSIDAGASWEVQDLPSSRAPRVMEVHPTSRDVIFVGFVEVDG